MIRQFQWGTDNEVGSEGWIPMWWKEAWGADARAVAHDALEHPLSMINSVENELMAFGAIWFGRGESGSLPSYFGRTTGDGMAEEVSSILRDVCEKGLTGPGRTTRLEDERLFQHMAKVGVEKFVEHECDSQDRGEWQRDFPHATEWTLGWLRRGYRWAQRRYKDSGNLDHLFSEVQRQVKEQGNHEEGTILTVRCKLDTLEVRVTTRHPYEAAY